MARLKLYVGEVTPGGTDGTPADALQCSFPLVWKPDSIPDTTDYKGIRVFQRFALRCDEGYRADDVSITFDRGKFFVGFINENYVPTGSYFPFQDSVKRVDVGSVGNTNVVIRLYTGFYPGKSMKIGVSFTEVAL